ncbi:DUF5776 domain-containing protein [Levilactobacillus senmaizukei]|nr:DUF5776 domain-containing protein [Levilactobacillus senmaizukei]
MKWQVALMMIGVGFGTTQVMTMTNHLPTFKTAVTAHAAAKTTNVANGRYGTVDWYLTADGDLHLGAGTLGDDTASLVYQQGQLATLIAQAQGNDQPTIKDTEAVGRQVKRVVLDGKVSTSANASFLFAQLLEVGSFEHLDRLDTSAATNMAGMFSASVSGSVGLPADQQGNFNLTSLDVSRFDTSKVTDMSQMFYMLKRVTSYDLSSFNTDNVTKTTSMFLQNYRLTNLDFSKATFANLQNAEFMFGSTAIETLNFASFAPPKTFSPFALFGYQNGDFRKVTFGPKTYFKTSPGLNNADKDETYTGKWQAVGKGSDTNPLGAKFDTGAALTSIYDGVNNPTTVASYVWEPVNRTITPVTPPVTPSQKAQPVTVRYLDGQGKNLATDQVLTGELGESYRAPKLAFDGYRLVKTDGNPNGVFTADAQGVTFHYAPKLVSGGDSATVAPMASVVYSTKKIGLYNNKNFSKKTVKHWYAKQKRTNRPMFVVTGFATSKNGNLRYRVKDVNHGAKTVGKTGYITAKQAYVVNVYYQAKHKKIQVINAKGINSYQQKSLKTKRVHYKKGQFLKVKKLVRHNRTTRYQLTNGQYVTANKKLVIAK